MFNIFTIISARYDIAPRAPLGKGFIVSIVSLLAILLKHKWLY